MHGHYILMKSIVPIISAGALLALCCSLGACSRGASDDISGDVVASIGSQVLTRTELLEEMPGGMTPDDSVHFVNAYINNWIDGKLVSEVATGEIDMTDIDRMVDEYRNTLIMQEYRRRMFETHASAIPEDTIRAYYNTHKDDFVLDRPMVKGTYLKVRDDARNLSILRRLYRSDKPADADKLEKEVLSSAVHYDYFRDRWVDWEQIETRIPFDFGRSASQWLRTNHTLDISVGGFIYLLYITDVLPSGSSMPIEAAKGQIVNRLLNKNRKAYDAQLMQALREKAEADGRLKIY